MDKRTLRTFAAARRSVVLVLAVAFSSVVSKGEGTGIASQVEIAEDGTATVSWETENDCSGAKVSFGIDFEEDPFGVPHYRWRKSATGSRRRHTVQISLKSIEEVARGIPYNGKVFYRATCFDRSAKSWLDSGDCVFRYVKRGDLYQRAVAMIEGPIVANVTSNSALIRWVTDMPSAGRVCLDRKRVADPTKATEHEIVLNGLQAGTVYPYRVETWSENGDILRTRAYRFRTAPSPGSQESFTFAVVSDTRAHDYAPVAIQEWNGVNADVLRQIVFGAFQQKVGFGVVVGDLISGATSNARKAELQLRSWKKVVKPVAHYIPLYTGIGNHDAEIYEYQVIEGKRTRVRKKGRDSAEEMFRREMTNPTNGPKIAEGSDDPTYCENVYSFDYGNSHFVILNNDYKVIRGSSDDAEKGKIVGQQLDWLRGDLESAAKRGLENIFVFFHEPAFPNGGHLNDSMYHNGDKKYVEPRNEFWRLLCQYRVAAVFCGHEHNYSRTLIDGEVDDSFSTPIWQIVTGGGGAPFHAQDRPPWRKSVRVFSPRQHYCIVTVEGPAVQIRVYDPAGNLMDQARLK